jgi:hypothetical protein
MCYFTHTYEIIKQKVIHQVNQKLVFTLFILEFQCINWRICMYHF